MTIGETYDPAMKITDQTEADAFFEARVQDTMQRGNCSREEAEAIERHNLGYYAGYMSEETRERVARLFKAPHPYFGGGGGHKRTL